MNVPMIVLIKSAGRCGSNLIVEHFTKTGYKLCYTHLGMTFEEEENIVIHDHSEDYLPNNVEKTFCFLVRRKDIKAQALSWFVVKHLEKNLPLIQDRDSEIYNASKNFNKTVGLISIPEEAFIEKVREIQNYDMVVHNLIKKNKIKHTTLYFEDFVTNPKFFDMFTIKKLNRKSFNMQPSKTQASSLVENYEQLMSLKI